MDEFMDELVERLENQLNGSSGSGKDGRHLCVHEDDLARVLALVRRLRLKVVSLEHHAGSLCACGKIDHSECAEFQSTRSGMDCRTCGKHKPRRF